jgi:hypothetical protein
MADLPEKQVKRLRALIQEAETNLAAAKELLMSLVGDDPEMSASLHDENIGKVIEGVFDGQNMVGSDAKTYPVPANYASKSKLVQGDILKLTIAEDGAFLYKQIGPIPRKQIVGVLTQNTAYCLHLSHTSKQNQAIKSASTYQKMVQLNGPHLKPHSKPLASNSI